MSTLRVLHVDDEPDIRELVEISLALDPDLNVKSCSCGGDALVAAAEWSPDVILMDVMMPVMDGPQTFGHLQERAETAKIPVVFMTARAQTRELAQFMSLGAAGVIAKPFDPMTLAGSVRSYLHKPPAGLDELKRKFMLRALDDSATLAIYRKNVKGELDSYREAIENIAHALLGAAGVHGCDAVGQAAQALVRLIDDERTGIGDLADVEAAIDRLIVAIDRDCRRRNGGMTFTPH